MCVLEKPRKTSIFAKPDFSKFVGGTPGISIELTTTKHSIFEKSPTYVSCKTLGKQAFCKAGFQEVRKGYPRDSHKADCYKS